MICDFTVSGLEPLQPVFQGQVDLAGGTAAGDLGNFRLCSQVLDDRYNQCPERLVSAVPVSSLSEPLRR